VPIDPNTPDPNATDANAPDPRDVRIKELNAESRQHRLDAKKAKDEAAAAAGKYAAVLETLGAQGDEELVTMLDELKARRDETAANPALDPKVLFRERQQFEKDASRAAKERDAAAAERDAWKGRFVTSRISGAIRSALADNNVKPAYHGALTKELQDFIRLDDNLEPVWVVKVDGKEMDELPVADGLKQYFEKNSDWLPPSATDGAGTPEARAVRPKPAGGAEIFRDVANYKKTGRPSLGIGVK
jgi:hypothetical protein